VDPVSLFGEFKRRRVFRALIGYGIAAFAVLQIVEPITHALHWPEAVLSYVVVALAAGFPIIVTVAWIFDVSAGRIERTAPSATAAGLKGTRLALLLVVIGGFAAAPGLVWYFVWPGRGKLAEVEPAESIAVVPFVNMSSDKENEYFSDGITEELINALANVEGLRVASRTSVYALKGRNLDAREIGARLKVKTLLEGSVRREGSALRVTAQLINVADDVHLWSKVYERELKGLFALENEIAHSIAQTLRSKLAGALVKPSTTNLEAHDLYLQGRYFSARRTANDLRTASQLFAKAVEKDPAYALAWAGLAETTALQHQYGPEPASVVLPKAKQQARRALDLDPAMVEAQSILGLVALSSYQWAEAEQALRKAIELNPRYALAHHWYAAVLSNQGRHAEAYMEIDRAYRLDPGSPIINNNVGVTRYLAGDFDGAIEAFRKTLDIAPDFSPTHGYLAELYAVLRRYAEAEAEYARCTMPGYSERGRGVMYALAGRRREALRLVEDLERRPKRDSVSPTARGSIWIALGEKDRGYALLARACAESDQLFWDMKVDPLFEELRADPRFHEVLRCFRLE
jgi:TolB-like protein/Tfp pilus assembly protein PilF